MTSPFSQVQAEASFEQRDGLTVAARFGAVGEEVLSARRGLGLMDLEHRGRLSLLGRDRASFLHGQCTNEVSSLKTGSGRCAFILDRRGKNLAHISFLLTDEEILLETSARAAPLLLQRFEHFTVIEDVVVEDRGQNTFLLLLTGPALPELMQKAFPDRANAPHEGFGGTVPWRGRRLHMFDSHETGQPAVRIWGPREAADDVWQILVKVGARPMGFDALDILRTEAGTPWWGRDYDEDCLPAETGLADRTVSFEKGCYVGQEQVAKQHYRGRLRKTVAGLLPLERGASCGDCVLEDAQPQGHITTLHDSPTLQTQIALALLKGSREVGAGLTIQASATGASIPARVVQLPFA